MCSPQKQNWHVREFFCRAPPRKCTDSSVLFVGTPCMSTRLTLQFFLDILQKNTLTLPENQLTLILSKNQFCNTLDCNYFFCFSADCSCISKQFAIRLFSISNAFSALLGYTGPFYGTWAFGQQLTPCRPSVLIAFAVSLARLISQAVQLESAFLFTVLPLSLRHFPLNPVCLTGIFPSKRKRRLPKRPGQQKHHDRKARA